MASGKFATVINCMDGRVQLNVNGYIREKFGVDYVDTITLAGPCLVLAEGKDKSLIDNIKFHIDISVKQHFSKVLAIVGHVDCAAVKVPDQEQKEFVLKSVQLVKTWNSSIKVLGLWVDENWSVNEITEKELHNV